MQDNTEYRQSFNNGSVPMNTDLQTRGLYPIGSNPNMGIDHSGTKNVNNYYFDNTETNPNAHNFNPVSKGDTYTHHAISVQLNTFYNGLNNTSSNRELMMAYTLSLYVDVARAQYLDLRPLLGRQFLDRATTIRRRIKYNIHNDKNIVLSPRWNSVTQQYENVDHKGTDQAGREAQGNHYGDSKDLFTILQKKPFIGEMPNSKENIMAISYDWVDTTMSQLGIQIHYNKDAIEFNTDNTNILQDSLLALYEGASKISADLVTAEILSNPGVTYIAGNALALDSMNENNVIKYEDFEVIADKLRQVSHDKMVDGQHNYMSGSINYGSSSPHIMPHPELLPLLTSTDMTYTLKSMGVAGDETRRFYPAERYTDKYKWIDNTYEIGMAAGVRLYVNKDMLFFEGGGAVMDEGKNLESQYFCKEAPRSNKNYAIPNAPFNGFKYIKMVPRVQGTDANGNPLVDADGHELTADGQRVKDDGGNVLTDKKGTNDPSEADVGMRFNVYALLYIAPGGANLLTHSKEGSYINYKLNSSISKGNEFDKFEKKGWFSLRFWQGVDIIRPERIIVIYSVAKKV